MNPTKRVTRIDQSPMNKLRWCMQLECGHEVWVTASRKPKFKTERCERCRVQSLESTK
jgi:hypothetical protein